MAFITIVLFLAAGSTWMIELGGLQKEQLQFITTNMKPDLQGKEYMGKYLTRFSVDLPSSDRAPPLSAVAPLLDVFSRMGYSLVSHNDEVKPNMNYLTWVLNKDGATMESRKRLFETTHDNNKKKQNEDKQLTTLDFSHNECCWFMRAKLLRKYYLILQIFVGYGLLILDMVQLFEKWLIEKRENPVAFTVRYSIWIAYWFHVCFGLLMDIYLFKASRTRNTRGLMTWSIVTFFNSSWAGIVYYFHTVYFGIHVPTITIYNGYLIYRYYTVIVVYYYVKEIKYDEKTLKACRELTDEEIKEFEEGLVLPPPKNPEDSYRKSGIIANEYANMANNNPELAPATVAKQAQYSRYKKEEFEISLESLIIDETQELGRGAYGKVCKGYLTGEDKTSVLVAVKTINQVDGDVTIFKALLSELKIMTYLGMHENVVSLIGASTAEIRLKKLFIVLEFCAFGSLFDYLRGCRGLFCSQIKDGVLIKTSNCDSYSNYQESDAVSTKDIFKWAYQTADGMAFLESRKVIHGDLATRNVLLTAERNVKITDFGLSRQLYQYSVYVKRQNTPLPWRWLALESITDMTFSAKSDVWSYGVTAWEMFSLGEIPWPKENFDLEFARKLRNGMRMAMPPNCTEEIYAVLLYCWRKDPKDRPSFEYLCKFFRDHYDFLDSA